MPYEDNDDGRRRWHLIFHGRVQGVGFRATVNRIARRFPISGFVRNLSNGTVEVVAEGNHDDLQQFRESIESSFVRNIQNSELSESPAEGEFEDFRVR